MSRKKSAVLTLEDGTIFTGFSFGAETSVTGEVVFNTAMIGYPELLSNPAMRGHIVVMTYPLTGNYGVPPMIEKDGLLENFESSRPMASGLVVTDYSEEFSHWNASQSLSKWLKDGGVPAVCGIDTRALAKHLRERGEMRGKITIEGALEKSGPADLIADVSIAEPKTYGTGDITLALIDTGVPASVIRSLVKRGTKVVRLPWDFDPTTIEWDGLVLVGAPDDPSPIKDNVRKALDAGKPVLGVCGGDLLLALGAGGSIKKLGHSHRGVNQPVLEAGTNHALITTQNHTWAVDEASLPAGWKVWFTNLNDGSPEGIRHASKPFCAVAWHPESTNRPEEADSIYDNFIDAIKKNNGK